MKRLTNPWRDIPGYFCFGCAPDNKAGVRMSFYSDGDDVVSVWKPEQQFQGWLDTLHGGIQAVMLDEISKWGTPWTSCLEKYYSAFQAEIDRANQTN